MKASSIYSTFAKSAALAALAVTALVGATTAQARPHYIQDVQYLQVSPQLVITPPQLIVQAPVYVHPRQVYQQHPRPAYVQPIVVQEPVQYAPPYPTRYVTGRIYYIDGRPFLNGHPYRGYGKVRHHKHHGHGHGNGHGNGHGHGHGGGHR